MDRTDRKILTILQEDATRSIADIAERVELSQTPCWRRIRNLEKTGVIRQRVAILDRDKLNLGVTVFVALKTNQHNPDWMARLSEAVVRVPEVVGFYRMSGDVDYLLQIVVPDIAAYDGVYKRLISAVDLSDVSSSFVMEEIKRTHVLPLTYVR